MLQTEFEFTLPCGYVDGRGTLHRHGVMRRSRARDEIELLDHPRIRTNEAYLMVVLLSRVIVRLGAFATVTPAMIEDLFSTDFLFLQNLYMRINSEDGEIIATICPSCGARLTLDLAAADHQSQAALE